MSKAVAVISIIACVAVALLTVDYWYPIIIDRGGVLVPERLSYLSITWLSTTNVHDSTAYNELLKEHPDGSYLLTSSSEWFWLYKADETPILDLQPYGITVDIKSQSSGHYLANITGYRFGQTEWARNHNLTFQDKFALETIVLTTYPQY